jgi:hypothetical protein
MDDKNSLKNRHIKPKVGQKKKSIDEDLKKCVGDFLDEIKSRTTFKKLYMSEHTHRVCKNLGITSQYLPKLFERMLDGKGLFCQPVLLGAVLTDMSYPADRLFVSNRSPLTAEFVLGPGTAQEIQRIISSAIATTEKPIRQLGIRKRIWAGYTILFSAKNFLQNKNYEGALFVLFFMYSVSNLALYPHGRSQAMKSIDLLAKYLLQPLDGEQSKLVGSVLILSYLIFEISRLSYSFIHCTKNCKNRAYELWPLIIGFKNNDSDFLSETTQMVNKIDSIFFEIVQKITSKETLPSFIIPVNTLKASIDLLEKLLDFKLYTSDKEKKNIIDSLFNYFIQKKEMIDCHFCIEGDNLTELFDKTINYLTLFREGIKIENNTITISIDEDLKKLFSLGQ